MPDIDRCEKLERGEWAEHDVDLVAFGDLLGLVLAPAGLPPVSVTIRSILRPESVKFLLRKRADAFLEMNAAGGERPGFHREQADLERCVLRDERQRRQLRIRQETGDDWPGTSCHPPVLVQRIFM